MIDFHNHIIPNVDDGSNSIEMSLSMLQKAAQTGITKVVTTTHYNHPYMKERFPDFKKINIKLDELRKEMLKNNLNIEIHSSAEVYFNESVLKSHIMCFSSKHAFKKWHDLIFNYNA